MIGQCVAQECSSEDIQYRLGVQWIQTFTIAHGGTGVFKVCPWRDGRTNGRQWKPFGFRSHHHADNHRAAG